MPYEATLESPRAHPAPSWFRNAKLGSFVHWGPYSVPAWVNTPMGTIGDVMDQVGPPGFFVHSPYADWYGDTMKLPNSPTHRYHAETYGAQFEYRDFVPQFNQDSESWDPDQWATLFERVGARCVILTTKHHDGFLLWPSVHKNPVSIPVRYTQNERTLYTIILGEPQPGELRLRKSHACDGTEVRLLGARRAA